MPDRYDRCNLKKDSEVRFVRFYWEWITTRGRDTSDRWPDCKLWYHQRNPHGLRLCWLQQQVHSCQLLLPSMEPDSTRLRSSTAKTVFSHYRRVPVAFRRRLRDCQKDPENVRVDRNPAVRVAQNSGHHMHDWERVFGQGWRQRHWQGPRKATLTGPI